MSRNSGHVLIAPDEEEEGGKGGRGEGGRGLGGKGRRRAIT